MKVYGMNPSPSPAFIGPSSRSALLDQTTSEGPLVVAPNWGVSVD
jgi:hypothetical protein